MSILSLFLRRTKIESSVKKILPVILFFWPLLGAAQLSEDFSDGDFTVNPAWSGDVSKWLVTGFQLRSNSSVVDDTFALSTPFAFADSAQWEFWLKLDHSTSSANYADIYLVANSADLKASHNGYFVRVGGTPDEISLYRRDGSSVTKIIDGADGRSQPASSGNQFNLKITRDQSGVWTLMDDNTGTGTNFVTEGTIPDATYTTGIAFGFFVKQSTNSFFSKHFFDDIDVSAMASDNTPPTLISATAVSATALDLIFSEPVDALSASIASN